MIFVKGRMNYPFGEDRLSQDPIALSHYPTDLAQSHTINCKQSEAFGTDPGKDTW
jgi:hypothetical protein